MIDLLGILYEIGKDLKEHYEWKQEDKLVELPWVEKSGFKRVAEANGYTLYWSRPDRIESRKIDGYEVMFELDEVARMRRRLVTRDSLVLLGRKA